MFLPLFQGIFSFCFLPLVALEKELLSCPGGRSGVV
jgi:hypothetical protein